MKRFALPFVTAALLLTGTAASSATKPAYYLAVDVARSTQFDSRAVGNDAYVIEYFTKSNKITSVLHRVAITVNSKDGSATTVLKLNSKPDGNVCLTVSTPPWYIDGTGGLGGPLCKPPLLVEPRRYYVSWAVAKLGEVYASVTPPPQLHGVEFQLSFTSCGYSQTVGWVLAAGEPLLVQDDRGVPLRLVYGCTTVARLTGYGSGDSNLPLHPLDGFSVFPTNFQFTVGERNSLYFLAQK